MQIQILRGLLRIHKKLFIYYCLQDSYVILSCGFDWNGNDKDFKCLSMFLLYFQCILYLQIIGSM